MPELAVSPGPVAQRLTRLVKQRGEPRADPRGIRRRQPNDVSACVRLAALSSSGKVRHPPWRDWLTAEEVVEAWVAEHRGEILGHVALSEVGVDPCSAMRWREVTGLPTGELLAVSRLFVRRRVRGKGLGTALLEMAVAGGRARGRIPVVEAIGAAPDELELYANLGWRSVGLCPARLRADGVAAHFFLPPRV
jgi:GNAT superfamily N-acetyltransferase